MGKIQDPGGDRQQDVHMDRRALVFPGDTGRTACAACQSEQTWLLDEGFIKPRLETALVTFHADLAPRASALPRTAGWP